MALETNTADDWDSHWEQFSQAAELGPTPRYRRRLIYPLLNIRRPGKGVHFVEIGSGTGEFAQEFVSRYPEASFTGLELSHVGVAKAKQRVRQATFIQRDLSNSTDAPIQAVATHVLCSEVLEHVEDPVSLLRNVAAYCANGCQLIVTVPGGPMNAFYRHIGHRRHYTPQQLASLLEASGFRVERAFGAGFPFFNLFRLFLSFRGNQLVRDVSGNPSIPVKIGGVLFSALFWLNSRRAGWQTVAVARYPL